MPDRLKKIQNKITYLKKEEKPLIQDISNDI